MRDTPSCSSRAPTPMTEQRQDSKFHRSTAMQGALAHARRRLYLVPVAIVAFAIYRASSLIVSLFQYAEQHVDRDSPWHMFLFFAVTLPFHVGLPIPAVHQVWAVAIGCFFRWRAFPILIASLAVGVPLPFLIGRRLAVCAGSGKYAGGGNDAAAAEAMLWRWSPRGTAYLAPLRRTIAARPVRTSFLLMWAPIPTSTLPLLVGFLVPPRELPLTRFVLGALPSKLVHFACDVLVGLEAGSLAMALDAHDDLPGVNDLPSSQQHARLIAIGAMLLTVGFMAMMVYTMHQALRDMKAKEAAEDLEEGGALLSSPTANGTTPHHHAHAAPSSAYHHHPNGSSYSGSCSSSARRDSTDGGGGPSGGGMRSPLLRASPGGAGAADEAGGADGGGGALRMSLPGSATWQLTPTRLESVRVWDAGGPCTPRSPGPGSPNRTEG